MRTRMSIAALAIAMTAVIAASCKGNPASKVIKSTQADDMTITLTSATGELKTGENELIVSFTDASNKPVDIGAATLTFHMPAMGSMAEMNDPARLTTTTTPGRFFAHVNIEVDGSWDARFAWEGPHGSGQTSMNVQAK